MKHILNIVADSVVVIPTGAVQTLVIFKPTEATKLAVELFVVSNQYRRIKMTDGVKGRRIKYVGQTLAKPVSYEYHHRIDTITLTII